MKHSLTKIIALSLSFFGLSLCVNNAALAVNVVLQPDLLIAQSLNQSERELAYVERHQRWIDILERRITVLQTNPDSAKNLTPEEIKQKIHNHQRTIKLLNTELAQISPDYVKNPDSINKVHALRLAQL